MMEEKAKSWVCWQLVQKPEGEAEVEMLGHLTSVSVKFMICIKTYIQDDVHQYNTGSILRGASGQWLLLPNG